MAPDVSFRLAGAADVDAVARLHAASWRQHYRGCLSEAYLAGPIEDERRGVWQARLGSESGAPTVVLAEEQAQVMGFACVFENVDPVWGSLVDNLHVAADRKGGGIGRALMHEVAGQLSEPAADRPIHLYVIETNHPAFAFYARIGGTTAGMDEHRMPDGSRTPVIRILWPTPAALAASTGRRP